MSSSILQTAAETQIRQPEWTGATSQKFTTFKKHTAAPQPNQNQPHPLFSAGNRQHFKSQTSKEFEWKSSVVVAHNKDAPRPDKPSGVKYLNPTFGANTKRRPERHHEDVGRQTFNTYEEAPVGKQTFVTHNRKTQHEASINQSMGSKKRISTMYE